MNEPLKSLAQIIIPAVEQEMQEVCSLEDKSADPFFGLLHYHMGWVNQHFEPTSTNAGKRIRPLLCLLSASSASGDWQRAVPGAASVELLHNFTLIHDDIQDASPTRRGRKTLWQISGVSLAINSGDAMYALAHLAMSRLRDRGISAEIVVQAIRRLDETCIALTIGQHADMIFEERTDVTTSEYLTMINGKTAELLAFSTELGGRIAGCSGPIVDHFAAFGRDLGMAFQVRDDILGIWGEESKIGKSAATDIVTRKKSLPVLYGLSKSAHLRQLYEGTENDDDFVQRVVTILDEVGAREFCEQYEEEYAESALMHLEQATQGSGEATTALRQLTRTLLNRQV